MHIFGRVSAMTRRLTEHLGTVVAAVEQRCRSLGRGDPISPFIVSILLKLRVMEGWMNGRMMDTNYYAAGIRSETGRHGNLKNYIAELNPTGSE